MSIEKGIRAFASQPFLPPLEDKETLDGNEDLGILDTTRRSGKTNLLSFVGKVLPEQIILTVRLNTIPFDNKITTFQTQIDNDRSEKKYFYSKQALYQSQRGHVAYSQYQAIELLFNGQGSYIHDGERRLLSSAPFSLNVEEGQCVLKKTFLFQTQKQLFCRKRFLTIAESLITPPYGKALINHYPLLAYGGYVKPGHPLTAINQIFAEITLEDTKQLYLNLYSQRTLSKNTMGPPRPGYMHSTMYHYIDQFRSEDLLSLVGHIQKGKGVISIQSLKESETEDKPEPTLYQTYRYTQGDPSSGLVDLYFKPA